ncbi:retrotransposon protein, putative, ty1-copia subclass [Tanacetum coccineum]|uniref:Retrotransposon protein, putative, ty1-copia subclass n=1 Tax=Tanacetum coccineum TaxID=301880 RepID=A0ABQ5EHE4_9ASTR
MVVSVESIRAISAQFANTVYGFFFEKRVAYPIVANYFRNTWGKYGLVKSMLNSSTRIFSFQFSSMDDLDAMLENEDVGNVWVWVKLDGVPVNAFSEDGLSAIATKLVWANVELKDTIVVPMPKLFKEGFYTCNVRVKYEWKPPRCVCYKVFGHTQEECPKNPGLGMAKNLKKLSQAPRGVPVGPKVGFKPIKEYRPVSKKPTVNTSGTNGETLNLVSNGANSSGSSFWNVETSSTSTTPIMDKIRKLEKLIMYGKVTLVYDDDKPLKKVDYLGESVDNDMARSMASERVGFGTKSLLEQWRDSYENCDYDKDPYDDDMYDDQDIPDQIQDIYDNLDIIVRGHKKKQFLVSFVVYRSKLMHFLMRLNDDFEAVRNQIMSMDPFPNINKAYYIVQQVEKHKQVTHNVSDPTAFFANTGGNRGNQGSRRDNRESRSDLRGDKKYRTHCKQEGHQDTPNYFAYENEVHGEKSDMDQRMVAVVCQEMMKMFKGKNVDQINVASTSKPHASTYFYGCKPFYMRLSFHVSLNARSKHLNLDITIDWIVDTGASDHMSSHLLLFQSIRILKCPIKIKLPDGTSKLVTKVLWPNLETTKEYVVHNYLVQNNNEVDANDHMSNTLDDRTIDEPEKHYAEVPGPILPQLLETSFPTTRSTKASSQPAWLKDFVVAKCKAFMAAVGPKAIKQRVYPLFKDKDFNDYPLAKAAAVRFLIAIATAKGWPLHQLDVNNAFLHGYVEEDIYMKPPQGYTNAMKDKFGEGDFLTMALVYVDDILITGNSDQVIMDTDTRRRLEVLQIKNNLKNSIYNILRKLK